MQSFKIGASPLEAPETARIFGTFGFYRYALALLVMLSHLLPPHWQPLGEYAVFGFFILSGYVVSYILYYTYLPLKHGLRNYILNRALRIYPAFWVASLFMLAVLVLLPAHFAYDGKVLNYPHGLPWTLFLGWLALNLSAVISVLLLGYLISPTLLPLGWSLGVEIFYWLLIPWMLTKPRFRRGVIAFALCYTLGVILVSFHPPRDILILRYFAPMAGALPFSLGVAWFLHKQKAQTRVPRWAGMSAMALMGALALFFHILPDPYFSGFYLAVALNAVIIFYLSGLDQRHLSAPWRKLDLWCGELAYPLFLMHPAAGLLMQAHFPALQAQAPLLSLTLAIFLAHLLALLLHITVELPVNLLRAKIKAQPF